MADKQSDEERIREVRRQALEGIRRLQDQAPQKGPPKPKPPEVPLEQRPGVWNDIGEYRLAARRVKKRRQMGGMV